MKEWWFSLITITKGEFITALVAVALMGLVAIVFETLWLKERKRNKAISSKGKLNR